MWLFSSGIMETLDLRLRVDGHPTLDVDSRDVISGISAFSPLSHSAQAKFLKNINIVAGSMILQVQEAAVIFDEQWVVSIHAHKLHQCASAMAVLLNAMGEAFKSRVSIEVIERVHNDGLPLEQALERQEKLRNRARYVEAATILALGGLISLAIQLLTG